MIADMIKAIAYRNVRSPSILCLWVLTCCTLYVKWRIQEVFFDEGGDLITYRLYYKK